MLKIIFLSVVFFSMPLSADGPDTPLSLKFIEGSTVKLEQLIGDYDKGLKRPTKNQSFNRFKVLGTDLGYPFEHQGKVVFLFGDTMTPGGGDVIATSETTSPEQGMALEFLQAKDGGLLKVQAPKIDMGGFNIPVAGISLNDQMYVVLRTNHSNPKPQYITYLSRFDPIKEEFSILREMSRLPQGKTIQMSLHEQSEDFESLPAKGPYIFIWSTGAYRSSNAYLSIIPKADFEGGKSTLYFAGLDEKNMPKWSSLESEAKPIVDHPTIGELSVTWSPQLKAWLMLYDSRDPKGLVFRYARNPWGPWSEPQLIFKPRDAKNFIHTSKDDGLEGVVFMKNADPIKTPGGPYAPFVIERFTKFESGKLTLYYVLSTWNPYVVVLMKSEFK